MKTYFDGVERISHTCSAQDLITSALAMLTIGSRNDLQRANALIDKLRISGVERSPQEIASQMMEAWL